MAVRFIQILQRRRTLLVAGGFFLLYGATLYGVLSSGDSVENVRQIEQLDLWSRSSHFTFHLFGILFYLFLNALFGMGAILSSQIMLAVFGVAGTVCFYRTVRDLFGCRDTALLAVVVYGYCTGVWRFAIQSEYLILVPSLMLISFRFAQTGHAVPAGIFLGLGGLTSPFVAAACPFFLYGFKPKKKNLFFLGAVFAVSMAVYFGVSAAASRGIAGEARWTIGEALYRFFMTARWGRGAAVFIYGMVRAFHVFLPLALYGAYLLYRRDRHLFLLAAGAFLLHLPTTLSEARQGAYFLGFYPFMAAAAAVAVLHTFRRNRRLAAVSAGIYCIVSACIVIPEMVHFRDIRSDFRRLMHDRSVTDGATVLVYPSQKPFNYYTERLRGESLESYVASVFAEGRDYSALRNRKGQLYLMESGIRIPDDWIKALLAGRKGALGTRSGEFGQVTLRKMFPQVQLLPVPGYRKSLYRVVL